MARRKNSDDFSICLLSVSLTRKVSPLQDAVFGLASMGIKPWLELSYGNGHYVGGGKNGPGAAVPNSSVALQAFADWATAVAERYANVTDMFELWCGPSSRLCVA